MLDFSWIELLLLIAVALIVIGPEDIPKILYGLGRIIRRLQYVRFVLSQQFDDILKAGDIEELRKGVNFEDKKTGKETTNERE